MKINDNCIAISMERNFNFLVQPMNVHLRRCPVCCFVMKEKKKVTKLELNCFVDTIHMRDMNE